MVKPNNWKEVNNLSKKSYKEIIDNYEQMLKILLLIEMNDMILKTVYKSIEGKNETSKK